MTRTRCVAVGILAGVFLLTAMRARADEDKAVTAKPGAHDDHACCKAKAEGQPGVAFEYVALATNANSSMRPKRERPIRFKSYKAGDVKDGGTIEGTITFEGKAPSPREIAIVKDKETCGKRETKVPLVRVNDKKQVADAVVFLTDIRTGKAFDKRDKPPVINQHHCTFEPHVQAVRLKEDVAIVNSDPVAHNIKADQRVYTLFNVLQPQQGMKSIKQFDRAGLVSLRCNVHDWMQGYLWVFPHPYYVVTGEDGAFSLKDVPAGKYELVVWQEHLGTVRQDIEVKAGATSNVDIVLKAEASDDAASPA